MEVSSSMERTTNTASGSDSPVVDDVWTSERLPLQWRQPPQRRPRRSLGTSAAAVGAAAATAEAAFAKRAVTP